MSGQDGSVPHLTEDKELPPAEAQIARSKKPEESDSIKEKWEVKDAEEEEVEEEEEEEEDEEEEVVVVEDNSKEEEAEEEEMATSAHLEPNTLPWPEDKDKRPQTDNDDGVWSEKRVSDPEDGGTELHGGNRGLSEERSQAGNDGKSKWRESMPEGDRWRDDEIELQRNDVEGGSLADDEDEGEEEEDDKVSTWISEKASLGFTPKVTIVHPSSKELPEESRLFIEDVEREPQTELNSAAQLYPEWIEPDDKYYLCEPLCGSKLKIALATAAAGLLFPLLLWGGYALLPFDPPLLPGTPLRVVYTLRCAFFGIIPIVLGVVVQGVARLRYSALQPLYQGKLVNREVTVHWHYVNESLALFLFYFLQLAVMATYISQDLLKLVPLLTIIFVFGRLIYWLCLSLDSSIRGLGFGFSFFPILVMLGTNLYFICSSVGQGAVFNVEPPTTAPPPQLRWWG